MEGGWLRQGYGVRGAGTQGPATGANDFLATLWALQAFRMGLLIHSLPTAFGPGIDWGAAGQRSLGVSHAGTDSHKAGSSQGLLHLLPGA